MLRAAAAQATRSPRYFGKIRPSLTAPTWCPARPMRCRPLATDGGASICTTRSIAPMSMPSSSEDVATRPRSRPSFSASSMSTRCGRASDPWWARTSGSPASSFSAAARRSATRRLLTKISVEVCDCTSASRRGWIAVQIDGRVGPCEAGPLGMSIGSASRAMSSTGTSIFSSQRLAPAGVDDGDRARRRRGCGVGAGELVGDLAGGIRRRASASGSRSARRRWRRRALASPSEVQRHLFERPLRGRQPDPLQRALGQRLEALHRQRQVGAALGRHQRVDLVDDQRVEAAERLAGVRGQQQVERLRRRDDDVGRLADEAGALAGRRVAGADQDAGHADRLAPARRGLRDAGDRRPQVALDVDGQRLERGDVDDPAAALRRRLRLEHQPVQAPQERGQGLAAAGRGQEQRRFAPRDGGPALGLGRRRAAGEGGLEPVPHSWMKRRKPHRRILQRRARSTVASCLAGRDRGGLGVARGR